MAFDNALGEREEAQSPKATQMRGEKKKTEDEHFIFSEKEGGERALMSWCRRGGKRRGLCILRWMF